MQFKIRSIATVLLMGVASFSQTRLDTLITAISAKYEKINTFSADMQSYKYTCG
jgi:outer membrane lipoprotein-sorting protein